MDYKALGLKCGLEIHQQLSTNKLFCSCPSVLREDTPHFSVKRYLHAVQGESGQVDVAALHEQRKGNAFVYQGYDSTCLVELDEEPPHSMNEEALEIALEVALILKTKIVDAIQVMRKTVVDGSNTSGFQRTALIAHDGTLNGHVVKTVCIEEDSARQVKQENNIITYRLDRLGIPLIEIATGADITTPQQCKDVAHALGMILRSTGKVKRGIGTIRQDVNVSIAAGARVEIKGAQELNMLPLLVENEAKRQLALVGLQKELKKRKAAAVRVTDCTDVFSQTESSIVKQALSKKEVVLGMSMLGCAGLFGIELLPGLRFGTELSSHAKMAGVGGIFHSDELPRYGISEKEVVHVRKKLKCGSDGFVLVVSDAHRANRALDNVADRLSQALRGVPEEVRKAEDDGTTRYLRPIPGAARMYPETDVPLIVPDVKNIQLPELITEKVKKYEKLGLSHDLAMLLVDSDRAHLFDKVKHVKPSFVAEMLAAKLDEVEKAHGIVFSDELILHAFDLLSKEKITKDVFGQALIDLAKGTFDEKKYTSVGVHLEKELKAIIAANKGAPFGALMGHAMAKLKGKASGQEISEMLKKLMVR